MKNVDLTSLAQKDLVLIHNGLAEKSVKGFKTLADGQAATLALLESHSKGKANKAKLQLAVAALPIALLAVLAPAVPVAKDLGKLLPIDQRVLKSYYDAGATDKGIDKDKLASSIGVDPSSAKYTDALTRLYNLSLINWSDEGEIALTDAATAYVKANGGSFDNSTAFDELQFEKPRATRASGDGTRSRVSDDKVIKWIGGDKNPCNPAKNRYNNYEIMREGGVTVGSYKQRGGKMFDLLDAVKLGRVEFVDASDAPANGKKAKA